MTLLHSAVDSNTTCIFNFLCPNSSLDSRVVDIWTVQHLTAQLNKNHTSVTKALGLSLGKHKTKEKSWAKNLPKDDMEGIIHTNRVQERHLFLVGPPTSLPPDTAEA